MKPHSLKHIPSKGNTLPGEDRYPQLLGLDVKHLCRILGNPYASYTHRGRQVFMFVGGDEHIDCEVKDGFVVRVETHEERRSAARVKPIGYMPALLRYKRSRYQAEIIDFSVKSVALKIEPSEMPPDGCRVTLCSSLRTDKRTLTHITLVGNVIRTIPKEGKVILILDFPYITQSYQTLTDFINTRLALAPIAIDIAEKPLSEAEEIERPRIIKSDLCMYCIEPTCALDILNNSSTMWRAVENA